MAPRKAIAEVSAVASDARLKTPETGQPGAAALDAAPPNTQGAEDHPEPQGDRVEAPISEPPSDPAAPAGEAALPFAPADQTDGTDDDPFLRAGSATGKRVAYVVSPIEHNGYLFGADDPIPLTEAEFRGLRATGALAEADWDDLIAL